MVPRYGVQAGPNRRIFMQYPEPVYRLGINSDDHGFTFLVYEEDSSPIATVRLPVEQAIAMASAIIDTNNGCVYDKMTGGESV